MTRKLFFDIFTWQRLFPLGLLFILTYAIGEIIILTLGLKILKVNLPLKRILTGGGLLASFTIFIRPFIPNELIAFFVLTIIPMILLLKFYSKSKWIVCVWVSFILMVTTSLGPLLVISPLASSDRALAALFFESPYGILLGSVIESAVPAILLLMLNLFRIQIIPSPSQILTRVDFYDIYFYCGLFYWFYLSTMRLWMGAKNNPKVVTLQLFIEWAFSGSMVLVNYLRKVHDQKKSEKKEQEYQRLDQEYQRLKESKADPQQFANYCDLVIKNVNNPDIPEFENLSILEFTRREEEALCLIAQGKDNNEIAETLCLALGTVSNLVSKIKTKTGLEDRNKLILYAIYWVRRNKK